MLEKDHHAVKAIGRDILIQILLIMIAKEDKYGIQNKYVSY